MGEIHSLPIAQEPPHSVEAEQQLLGAILIGGATVDVVTSQGGAAIFYDPVHAEIFKVCNRLAKAGRVVSPVTVSAAFPAEYDESLSQIGGKAYFARLAGAAITPRFAADYAGLLADEKAKRDILGIMRQSQADLSAGDLSASDVAAKMEAAISVLGHSSSAIRPVSMLKAVTDALSDSIDAYSGESSAMVPSGIRALDHFTGGFGAGELWLLGGRPSMGKTGVMLSMALNAARAGHPVVIASLEMTPKAMATRALSEQTAQNNFATAYQDIRRGSYGPGNKDAIAEAAKALVDLPVSFLPREYQDADLLQVGVKQALRGNGSDKMPLVLVDYAQLMRSKARSRYEQITDISLALKGLAMSLEVPLIALSQLSRALEQRDEKRPMMSDLRESGQLEQDADGVIFCYRDEYYLQREEPDTADLDKYDLWQRAREASRNKLELIVAKQRQGEIGTAHVMFNPAINRIWER